MTVTWDHSLLKLVNISLDLVASSIEGGRSLDGLTGALDFSGSGLWRMTASVELYQPEEHRAWWQMAAILNGGVNSIVMPFRTDRINFDPTGYTTEITSDYAVGETIVVLKITGPGDGADTVHSGMMFGIEHENVLHRVYVIRGVVDVTTFPIAGYTVYTVKIRPALREAITSDIDIEFVKPGCRMRLPSGVTMAWDINAEQFWLAQNSIELIEALPVEDPPYG